MLQPMWYRLSTSTNGSTSLTSCLSGAPARSPCACHVGNRSRVISPGDFTPTGWVLCQQDDFFHWKGKLFLPINVSYANNKKENRDPKPTYIILTKKNKVRKEENIFCLVVIQNSELCIGFWILSLAKLHFKVWLALDHYFRCAKLARSSSRTAFTTGFPSTAANGSAQWIRRLAHALPLTVCRMR